MRPAKKRPPKRFSVIITAGPTREKIDPVRFISNYSTGTFGYELAKEANLRGYKVTLISGPSGLKAPSGIRFIKVESALDMRRAVLKELKSADCLIMAAAVSDWRPRVSARRKIKRDSGKRALELVENPDILAEAGQKKGKRILVGFALETEDLEKNALRKLREKNLDMIVANRLKAKNAAFGDKTVKVSIIDRFSNAARIYRRSKGELAEIILDRVERFKI